MDQLDLAQTKEFDSVFGRVTCKIPSVKERLDIAKRMQRYAETLPLPTDAWDLAEAMAHLDIVATDAPESFQKDQKTGGWDYDRLYDTDGLVTLGKAVKDWIESFRRSVREQQGKMGKN